MIDENGARRDENAVIEELDRRLVELEAQKQTLRIRDRVLLVVLAAFGLLAAAPVATVPDTLAAKRFALVDASGTVRALWRVGDGGAEFAILDASGATERVVTLASEAESAQDATGVPREQGRGDGSFIRFGKPEPAPKGEQEDDSFDWVE